MSDTVTTTTVDTAIGEAVSYLFQEQRADGLWTDTLPSSAVGTAPALVGLHYYDRRGHHDALMEGCAWLRQAQLPDGGWGDTLVTGGNLHATAFAIGALGIVDPDNSEPAITRGMRFIEANGGIEAVADLRRNPLRAICLTYWALAGFCDQNQVPHIPVELALLPKRLHQRMSFTVPGIFSFGLMQARTRPRGPVRRVIDRAAQRPALEYLRRLQRFEGPAGGFEESPMLVGVVMLGLTCAGLGEDIVRRCRSYLMRTRRPDGSWAIVRDLELTASTAVVLGLQEAGLARDQRLAVTLHGLLGAQRMQRLHATGAPAGGWAWSLPSGWPDVDDTAVALTALPGWGAPLAAAAIRAGVEWLLRMQRGDGSWGCFVTRGIVELDAPCPMLTAHALEGLHASARVTSNSLPVRKACAYLAKVQRPDGSFDVVWYRPYTMGTAAVVTACGKLGLGDLSQVRRAMQWLLTTQLPDGGWGDGMDAGPSVEETSWALYGLLEAGLSPRSDAAVRAAGWLVQNQTPEGGWMPTTLGVYFPNLYYHSDHVANGYALRALASFRRRMQHPGSS